MTRNALWLLLLLAGCMEEIPKNGLTAGERQVILKGDVTLYRVGQELLAGKGGFRGHPVFAQRVLDATERAALLAALDQAMASPPAAVACSTARLGLRAHRGMKRFELLIGPECGRVELFPDRREILIGPSAAAALDALVPGRN